MSEHAFSRTELLLGEEALNKLKNFKIVVFGIGGVGSFVVESLTRVGIGNLILIDNDTVSISNLNRQIHANVTTVNKSKVQVMKERILLINPKCNVAIHETFVSNDNIKEIIPKDANYVVDAIDTVTSKLALVEWCTLNNIKIISSMGTGNKLNPAEFKVADIYSTKICPLAKVMRHELKKRGVKELKVVYSEEVPLKPKEPKHQINKAVTSTLNEDENKSFTVIKRQTPGSISFVPPVAGMIIASEVVKDLLHIGK
ncbi:tRNA threonylcarbamoyladenosine dehydratase [Clostridium cellulovorans]|uniref:UBA/THIF-type NAD/FAD binding protein n=1 Tax=Clostridium cellulovorans (strain ATCC 35296 / DSM 3052 / OCM 3 / 743B) TaxID=573061 RepID=D9SSS8_CLOC7|nr:tRNA threonylcarbamoyladenosine dehydratase [Clostridium cellulovorans]ADL52590.1 UBA/THIF-type NAD/FAD binding protein [Clostridium cellulovorans 743B]